MTSQMLARDAVVAQLRLDGVRHVFGNPGTVEQGLLDSLAESDGGPEYLLALHETAAVGMADGYARATRRPTVVQLHTGVGLGNGIGMLYQAMRGHSPLVVLAGDAGLRYEAMDAQMAADLVGMARPVTKWATRVVDPDSVLRVLRRAMKVAATPPAGPVFVALPMDVLDAVTTEHPVPTSFLDTQVAPSPGTAAHAARTLVGAGKPMIIAGDGVTAASAQSELAEVAEVLGAEVWGADWAEVNLPSGNPMLRGQLGHMFGAQSSAVTREADAVLICGTYVFPEVFPSIEGVFAEGVPIVHIDPDTWEIAKNFPVDVGIAADLKPGLGMLADAIRQVRSPEQARAAADRVREITEAAKREHEAAVAEDRAVADEEPLHAFRFAQELATRAPADTVYFDEALTSSPELFRYLTPLGPGHYFQTRGGSLGVGIPGAVGLKLANPDHTVIGFVGDGGAMYTAEALWTAARYDIAAKLVICNNSSYELLKLNIEQYWAERGIPPHDFPSSFDLGHPRIDFVRLSEGLGVPATRVERAEQIGPAIDRALAHDGPFLIDLVVRGKVANP